MNICLVASEYATGEPNGGIATYTQNTAGALAALGQNVSVIAAARDAPSTKIEDGVTIIRVACSRRPPPFDHWSYTAARAIARLSVPPDIVQVAEWGAEGFRYAMHPRRRAKLITRLTTPTFLVERINGHAPDDTIVGRAIDNLERLQTVWSDAIISPTNALAAIVSEQWQIPRQQITIVRTGVDFAARYASVAAPLPVELRDREYIIYSGRLEQRKGVQILAEALSPVLAAHPELHVVFAGDVWPYRGTSLRTYIEALNAPYVQRLHFYPRLAHAKLYPLIQHALVAVLPSLWENLSNACLEAMDMGKAVVATRGCGFGEVLEDGVSGILVSPGDVSSLRAALLYLLANRQELAAMGLAAKVRVNAFQLDRVTRDHVRLYEDVCRSTSSAGRLPYQYSSSS